MFLAFSPVTFRIVKHDASYIKMPKAKDLRPHGITFEEAVKRMAQAPPVTKKTVPAKPAKKPRRKPVVS